MADRESQPLLTGGGKPVLSESSPESRRLWLNFLLMCIFFSLNHGCVVSCLAYASSILGDTLGAYGSGALYICYSLTALLAAKPVVAMVGPQTGLMIGVTGYCIYIGGFLFAAVVSALAWPVFLLACIIGGTAGGILWPSQGRYFAKNAKLYSESSGIAVDKVNATFAGYFAASYLGFEMITKLLATILYLFFPDSAYYIVFSVYTVIAFVSCFMVFGLDKLDELGTREFSWETAKSQVFSVIMIVCTDLRLALMIPFQVSFGFASSFIPYYVLGTVVSDYIGTTYVGLLSALIVLAGASTAIPSAYLANAIGKPFVMTVGGACIAFAGYAFYFFTDAELGTWTMIVIYLTVYGLGRGTWVSYAIAQPCKQIS